MSHAFGKLFQRAIEDKYFISIMHTPLRPRVIKKCCRIIGHLKFI